MSADKMSADKIPPITITAVGSKAKLSLHKLGRPAVLLFLWQETEALGDLVRDAVRVKYPEPAQVLIINLADLRGIPRMMRGMVERELTKGYKRTIAKLPEGANPAYHVMILPDWKGEVAEAVGAGDTHQTPAAAVLNADGEIVGVHRGDDLVKPVMAMLEEIV
jgi:hypothetical protein